MNKKLAALLLFLLIPAILIGLSLRPAMAYEQSEDGAAPRPTLPPPDGSPDGTDPKPKETPTAEPARPDILLISNAMSAEPGDQLTFTVVLTNNKDNKANGVEVRMPISEGLDVLSTSSLRGTSNTTPTTGPSRRSSAGCNLAPARS